MSTDEQERRKLASCSGCDALWGGRRTCHCAVCHRTFTGPTAFDQHGPGRCGHLQGDPPGLVVVRTSGNQQVWGQPDTGGRWGDPGEVGDRPTGTTELAPDVRELLARVSERATRVAGDARQPVRPEEAAT